MKGPSDDGARPAFDSSLIDVEQIVTYLGFAKRAISRHRLFAATLFLATCGLTAGLLMVWPRTYHAEATLLARRNDLMTTLSNPGRPARPESDDPTRAAWATVHERDNLLMIIRHTDLLNEWERTRGWLSQTKRRVQAFIRPESDEDRLNALVWLLSRRLVVNVEREGIVRISVDWHDPQMARRLVQTAVESFIENRHEMETAAIGETISILQESAASLQSNVDRTIVQLREEQAVREQQTRRQAASRAEPAPAAAAPIAAPAAAPAPGPDPETLAELARVKESLDTKRSELRRLEGAHRQQVGDVQEKLKSALTIYTDGHPTVSGLRQSLAAVSREPAELAPLRTETQLLERQYEALKSTADASQPHVDAAALAAVMQLARPTAVQPPRNAGQRAEVPSVVMLPADVQQLTDLVHPTSRLLTLQLSQLSSLLDRINAARLELATSGAGLKFRYSITRPAEVPRSPVKPKVPLILAAGFVAALLLAFAAAIALDVFGGRVLETWQVERSLGLPVLGIMRPAHE